MSTEERMMICTPRKFQYVLITCSQLLWINNKTTQLWIIRDLRLPKHYLLMGIMIIRRSSWRSSLHRLICEYECEKDKDRNYISLIPSYSYSIKHIWTSTELILHWYLWLARRWRRERVITIQREQYGVIVHLFISTGRNLSEITFMTLNIYLQTT